MSETNVKIHTIDELRAEYKKSVAGGNVWALDLGHWLPRFQYVVRPVVPGELCIFMADTAVGKTLILQSVAHSAQSHCVLFLSMELPGSLVFERFAAMENKISCYDVERAIAEDAPVFTTGLSHIYTCTDARMDSEKIGRAIVECEKVAGTKPTIVMVDYVGLMDSAGSRPRYERMSKAAEDLKVTAKQHNVVIIAATQMHRKENSDGSCEVSIHDARDSSSIEQSAGLLIGAWRSGDRGEVMNLKVLKNTKGRAGDTVMCNVDGARMMLTPMNDDQERMYRDGGQA